MAKRKKVNRANNDVQNTTHKLKDHFGFLGPEDFLDYLDFSLLTSGMHDWAIL